MDDIKKMFQTLVNGQSAMKAELLGGIGEVNKNVDNLDKKVDSLDNKIDDVEERLTERIDKIGLQIANLEDDTPTREEHDDLVERVIKVEEKFQV